MVRGSGGLRRVWEGGEGARGQGPGARERGGWSAERGVARRSFGTAVPEAI